MSSSRDVGFHESVEIERVHMSLYVTVKRQVPVFVSCSDAYVYVKVHGRD